jgi:putative endonuclease
MTDTKSIGSEGEDIAARHLVEKGYRILNRNWRAGKKEIDIVARLGEQIIFAEVKTRSEDWITDPASAVNREKQKMIILAADAYIKRYNIRYESRFDIVTVVKHKDSFTVEHIENAFYPTLR